VDAFLSLLGPGGAITLLLVLGAGVKWLDNRRKLREAQLEARAAQLDAEREGDIAELRAERDLMKRENRRLLRVAYAYIRQMIAAGLTPDPPDPHGGEDE